MQYLRMILNLLLQNAEPITAWLAKQYDKFKLSNPLIGTVVLSLLVGVNYSLSNCDFAPICENEYLKDAALFLSYFLLAITGNRTTRYVHPNETLDAEQKENV